MIKGIAKGSAILLTGIALGTAINYNSQGETIKKGIDQLQTTAITQNEKYKDARNEANKHFDELERLQTTVIPNYISEIESLDKEITSLENKIKELSKDNTANQGLIDQLKESVKELENNKARLEEANKALNVQVDNLVKKALSDEATIKDLLGDIENLKNNNASSNAELDKANKEIEKANVEQQELVDYVNTANQQVNDSITK